MNLRSNLIHLAQQNPSLRVHLLPVLASTEKEQPTPALEVVTAGIALQIAQSAILNNPFYTEGEVRKFLSVRRFFHKEFVVACLQFADECEAGEYGPGVKIIATPLRGVAKLLPTQDRQALVYVTKILRGLRGLHWQEVSPLVLRVVRQAISMDINDEERDPSLQYDIDYPGFFKSVLRLEAVPTGVKVLLRKIILLGKGDGRSLGLTPHEEENPGAWFDMPEEEKTEIRGEVIRSDKAWKDAANDDTIPLEQKRDYWLKSQAILLKAQRRAGVHVNIIKGEQVQEPIEDILKREAKVEVDGPTDFVLSNLRKYYVKMVSEGKKNIPREQRKVLTVLNQVKTLPSFQRVIQEAVDRKILPNGYFLDNIKESMDELGKNKAIRDGIPLEPLTWKPMSVEEFQTTHDTGDVEFLGSYTEESKRETLGRVSRAISDLERVFGKGFCGKHKKGLAFRFGGSSGFMAKASYFAWEDRNVWQPRVTFGEDYEGVLAHELSHYLDELLAYRINLQDNPEEARRSPDGNIFGRTGVTLDYAATWFKTPNAYFGRIAGNFPEIPELIETILVTPDYTRWKNRVPGVYDFSLEGAIKELTGQSMYDLPKDHPYYYKTVTEAKYKTELSPVLVEAADKYYTKMNGGDSRKLSYAFSSVEVWARVCEQYVYHRLCKSGISNPWLNWMTYDNDMYIEEKTFEEKIMPIMDRLFARLNEKHILASLLRRLALSISADS